MALIREDAAKDYTARQLETDVIAGWSGLIRTVAVTEVSGGGPGDAMLLLLDIAGSKRLGNAWLQVGETIVLSDGKNNPCEYADSIARAEAIREHFPDVLSICLDGEGRHGLVSFGRPIRPNEVNVKAGTALALVVQRVHLDSLTRCKEMGAKLRAALAKEAVKAKYISVVVLASTEVGGSEKGRAFIGKDIEVLSDAICLPGDNYIDWVAAHEVGHILLQLNDHPDNSGPCAENIMVPEGNLGKVTEAQRSRILDFDFVFSCGGPPPAVGGSGCLTSR